MKLVVTAEAAREATALDIAKLNDCIAVGCDGLDRFECQKADDNLPQTIPTIVRNPTLSSVLSFLL
ncbi:MAG: hypothetical protein AAGA08_14565 [Pseudomonadota bacterium]